MNLYDKIRNAECKIPESFCMGIRQMLELIDNSREDYDLAWIAFKFGYMQGQRAAKQTFKTNKAGTTSEAEQYREHIIDMVSRIGSERRLRRIFNIVHANFLDDGLEGLNERQD